MNPIDPAPDIKQSPVMITIGIRNKDSTEPGDVCRTRAASTGHNDCEVRTVAYGPWKLTSQIHVNTCNNYNITQHDFHSRLRIAYTSSKLYGALSNSTYNYSYIEDNLIGHADSKT